MNILEGATLYLDHKPLKGNPAKHFGALAEASKQDQEVGFTQARPPRLIATLFTDLAGEEALSDKLLELLTAEVTPTLVERRQYFTNAKERIRTDRDRERDIQEWVQKARDVFTALSRARSASR